MSPSKSIEIDQQSVGAADLVRVEVLVPSSARADVLRLAERLRADHRRDKDLQSMCDRALSLYGPRILSNIDLDRVPDLHDRASVIAHALMERGNVKAFALGRELLDRMKSA